MATCELDSGDMAWVTFGTVLIAAMTMGLGVFEAGLLRLKNTLSLLTQIASGVCILSFMWMMIGFSLTFSDDIGGIIGDADLFWGNFDIASCWGNTHIPKLLYSINELMFAVISPLLLTGAFAERLTFNAFIIMIVLWEALIYYPVAHWIWGGGWLSPGKVFETGVQDFAGGIVIHTSAGVSAIIISLFTGRRHDYHLHHGEPSPSNQMSAFLGALLLWIGWFGFNGSSSLAADFAGVLAVFNTHIAACTGGMTWVIIRTVIKRKKMNLITCLNGAIAGLAGVTPAAGYISTASAAFLGFLCGCGSWVTINVVKSKLHIDDALDVSAVHGVPGIIGSLFLGIAASRDLNPQSVDGAYYSGSGDLFRAQFFAVLIVMGYSSLVTAGICLLCYYTVGLRVSEEEQRIGLDLAHHGESVHNHDDGDGEQSEDDDSSQSTFKATPSVDGGFLLSASTPFLSAPNSQTLMSPVSNNSVNGTPSDGNVRVSFNHAHSANAPVYESLNVRPSKGEEGD